MAKHSLIVSSTDTGRPLVAWLSDQLRLTPTAIRRMIGNREIRVNGRLCEDLEARLVAGQRVECGAQVERSTRPDEPHLRFVDEHILIVDKPTGLTTMRHAADVKEFGRRAQRYLPRTLQDLLPGLIGSEPGRIRAVHRLDKETSGLLVFARSAQAEGHLGEQFRAHTVERRYRAIVRGRAVDGRIESTLVDDRGDGRRGSGKAGQRAVTHVALLESLGPYSLVECRLETGRTHQVRIHLGEAGTPLCGERVYDRPLHGRPWPDDSGIERVALHAATLGLEHPVTGKRMSWTSPLPDDLAQALTRLRAAAASS